jgi:hypothetical protein
MYTATRTVGATAESLRAAVNAVVPGEISDTFNGRCYQVVLVPSAATVLISFKGGTLAAGEGAATTAGVPISFQSPTGNQISIDEIFISGTGTVGIMILVM